MKLPNEIFVHWEMPGTHAHDQFLVAYPSASDIDAEKEGAKIGQYKLVKTLTLTIKRELK